MSYSLGLHRHVHHSVDSRVLYLHIHHSLLVSCLVYLIYNTSLCVHFSHSNTLYIVWNFQSYMTSLFIIDAVLLGTLFVRESNLWMMCLLAIWILCTVINSHTANLPKCVLFRRVSTQFNSCIYLVRVSMMVPFTRPFLREPGTTCPSFATWDVMNWSLS